MKVGMAEITKQNLRCGVFEYLEKFLDTQDEITFIPEYQKEEGRRVVFSRDISDVVAGSQFVLGNAVKRFETDFAARTGTEHCIGVGNGTDALRLALQTVGVGPGDKVIVPDYTFVATATAVTSLGATPIFVDVEPDTMTMDPRELGEVDTTGVKAIIPVHLFGHPANMDPIMEYAQENNLKVIEDCAQAHSTIYKGRTVGSIGDLGCFSFFPAKILGCMGDGGAVTTNNEEYAGQLLRLRTHGRSPLADGMGYDYDIPGGNSRLDGFQAAVLNKKLPHLCSMIQDRRETAQFYSSVFGDLVETPSLVGDGFHTFSVYTIKTERRDELKERLSAKGISTAIYYPRPLHAEPMFAKLQDRVADFPVSENLSRTTLSLPVHSELTEQEMHYVAENVRDALTI